MDFKKLVELGTVSTNLHKREIPFTRPLTTPKEEWADKDIPEYTGESEDVSVTVYLKPLNSADEMEIARADEYTRNHVAVFRSVRNPDGSQLFESLDQVLSIESWLLLPIFKAIMEVRPKGPKASARKKSSGSKSA